MDQGGATYDIASIALCIPAWQIGIYIGLNSIFMLLQERKLCLVTTYLFTFYWGFYVYGDEFMVAAGGSNLALSLYIGCGILLVVFSLYAFFQENG